MRVCVSILILGLFSLLLSAINASNEEDLYKSAAVKLLQDKFRDASFADLAQQFLQISSAVNSSSACRSTIDGLLRDAIIRNITTGKVTLGNMTELLQYVDATGKPGSGILAGNFYMLGSYSACEEVQHAHFCTANAGIVANSTNEGLKQLKGMRIPIGVCVPKNCSGDDIHMFLTMAVKTLKLSKIINFDNSPYKYQFGQDVVCDDGKKYSAGNIAAMVVISIFVMLCIISTSIDLMYRKPTNPSTNTDNTFVPVDSAVITNDNAAESNGTQTNHQNDSPKLSLLMVDQEQKRSSILECLLCFSLLRNCRALFSTKLPNGAIGSVNGIRAISMSWVILGHTYFFGFTGGIENGKVALGITHRFSFLAVSNAYVSVDTFFVLSGLLVSYLSLRRYSRNNKFPLVQYYLHRYLRLTPVYLLIIFLYIYIYPLVGSGPLWFNQDGGGVTNCKKYWWTNILYINNFFGITKQCIGWSWYLANDMQFYIITPIIIYSMYHLKTAGMLISNGVLLVATFIVTGVLIGYYKFNTLLTSDFENATGLAQAGNFFDKIYLKPYCRIAPYIVGIVLGYILFTETKPRSYKLPKMFFLLGWVVATAVALAVVYGPWHAAKEGGKPFNEAENIVYGTFMRFAWGCCVAWVIYACHHGYGGIVDMFLSWRAFIPLSRLTYCAYLVHPLVISSFYGSLQTPYGYNDNSVIVLFCGFLFLAYGAAFVVAVLVEFPLMALEKLLIKV